MSRLALYQKYRSTNFDEVIGQDYVVRSIRNAVMNHAVGHAYLFCGPRGTGKTTMARLLAKAVNCENPKEAPCGHCANCEAVAVGNHPDVVEINAANQTSVDNIRDLIDRARLAPMLGEHKIYIIDEVHQLSSAGSSALLKILEEPPTHVIFILATTDPQKLLATIVSRCQRFDFSKVDKDLIREHLLDIANQEGFTLEPAAAEKIALLADGGMRDSLSILEQCASYSNGQITEADINQIYGIASTEQQIDLINAIQRNDLALVLSNIRDYSAHGIDLKRFTSGLIEVLKDASIYGYTKKADLLNVLREEQAVTVLNGNRAKDLLPMMDALMKALESYKFAQSVENYFEIACLEMMSSMKEAGAVEPAVTPRKAPPIMNTPAPVEPKPMQETISQETPSIPVKEEEVVLPPEEEEAPAIELPEEEPIETPEPKKPIVHKEESLSADKLLRILVQCDKAHRAEDIERVKQILLAPSMNRYVAALKNVEVIASGQDCVVFGSPVSALANQMNETNFNMGLYEYLKDHGLDKMPFVAVPEEYQKAIQLYRECKEQKNLPEKLPIERYSSMDLQPNRVDPEAKLKELFGDMVEVYDKRKDK